MVDQPRAPRTTSAIELFDRMVNHDIVFFVDGHKIGLFEFTRHRNQQKRNLDIIDLICYAKKGSEYIGTCIQITIHGDEVHLDDYFHNAKENNYQCNMKPTSMEQHKRILKTFLEFLAYAFQKSTITLVDAASRKYMHCPPLYTGIHLVAGRGSFYGKAAGFKNLDADLVAEHVGKLPVPETIGDFVVPARYGPLPLGDGTLKDVANNIIQLCKTEQEISAEDLKFIKYIQAKFTTAYKNAKETPILDFYKKVTGIYGCTVKHADDMVDEKLVDPVNLEPGEPIKKFLSMDIITS